MRQIELSADVRVLFGQPTLAALAAAAGGQAEVVVPANRITPGCTRITPDLLPLATLDQQAIDRVVATVPGGVGNVQDIYGLAPLQAGILYHHLTATEGDPYVLQVQFGLEGPSQVQAFCRALQSVVKRHDILRTSVVWEGLDEPVQVVWRHAPLAVEQIEIDGQTGDVLQQLHERFDPRHYRLDFTQAPLLRFVYSQDLPNNRWVGILLLHHLVLDHTALAVLVHEMSASLTGSGQSLAAAVPYRNYVAQARSGVDREAHELFFREMLGDIDEPTLAFGLQDVHGVGRGIEEAHLVLETPLCLRLRQQARHLGVSVASLMHLAWAQVLGQVSGRDEVVFGTVLLGRMQGGEGADRALGMFINTLPLRVSVGAMGALEGVRATHSRLSRLLGHEHASLSLAQRCSGVPASLPLFSTLLNYRHSAADTATDGTLGWEGIQILNSQERSNYPLVLNVDDRGQGFELIVQALAEVDGERVGQYMQTALLHLVTALEQAPETPLHGVSILSVEERDSLLQGFNLTARPYPHEHTVQSLFEAQAVARPEASAVVHNGVTVSYAELNIRANRLAHHLLGLGVKPGDSVATLLGLSVDSLVCQLAIYKCAAVYVPLDINAPAERQHYMVQDSGAVVVLTLSTDAVSDITRCVEVDTLALAHQPVHNPLLAQSSEAVAYVMYTSGSTGAPKGVLVPHRAITRLVINNGYADFNERDRVAFASNPAFDASTLDVWAPLLNGGCVVVVEHAVLLSQAAFASLLQEQAVSVLWMTAGLFHQYADALLPVFRQLRYLIVGGDVLDPQVIGRVLQHGKPQHLLNGYGPTEATTFSTTFEITAPGAGSIPIGRPIANAQAYVLDARQQPLPLGVVGELYIGGAGVANGYLNQPQLTAEKFIPNPFGEGLLYRTGDLASWQADGTLLYQGRNDLQVKIRGFRIEPGEIETCLAAFPGVKDAVVLAREDEPGDKRLVAYYTAQTPLDIQALRAHLQGRLPDYMVPSAYVWLALLPLTANGKLDRKGLPVPDQSALLSRGYEAPEGEVETLLAQIWQDVLKLERVGRHDHFFELGGHSLLAVSLIERMRQVGLSADVRVLFSQPSLAALAAAVGSGREVVVPANLIPADCQRITPELLTLVALDQDAIDRIVASVPGGAANVQDIYPLAPLQEGILYHHITAEQGDPYLLQSQLAFDSLERLQAFAQALQKVSERHDILRTSVVWEGLQSPVQVVWRKAPLAVQEIPLNPADGDVLEQLHARFDARQFRLELTRAPLIQLVYGHDPIHQRVVAILLFHHMALDHTAMDVVGQEMRAFLFNQHHTLGAPVPYRNYVAQARLGVSEQEHEAFFRDMLGDIDEPTLPFGLHDVQGDGRHVEEATLAVDATLNLRLRKQARQLGVSAASLMHLAWAQVLGKVSSRQQVVFGTVLMGRMQGGEGADRALGMFINTLPLRVDVSGICVQAGVKATHARLTALLGHEHASLALAQRCSGVAASSPLFSALLNYRHSAPDEAAQEGLDIWEGIQVLGGEERSNYPLTLSVDDLGNGFGLTVLAVSPIAAQRVCGYMHSALEHLVQSLEQTPQRALSQLSILPQHEQDQLLAFNPGASDYPRGQTIHGLFEAQARRLPDAIAVVQGPHSLNYEQLNQRANQLAHHLRKLDVQPDDRVAICSRRGPEMLVGLLAILKAGAGYVPVDPAYPLERIAYLLQDSAPVAVLVEASTRDLLGEVPFPVVNLDGGDWQDESIANPSILQLTPAHLAYVIYTSGSTGLPKGVMVEHQTLENLVNWHCDAFDLREGCHTSSVAGFGFDAMAWEVWPALCVGATLHLPPASIGSAHIDELLEWWRAQPLDVSFLPTPVAEYAFSQQLEHPTLRTLLIGGDRLRQFAEAQSFKVINNYGPTEATVVATSGPVEVGQTLHIGKPMANARVYLLDEQQQPVPIGVAGELYVGGSGVARGYLNRPELTTERFLLDPFSPEPQARMYRTGDLARWLADGNIEYLGRNDDQVKIRGVRIELGEIEAALSNHEAVSEAVVLLREGRLIAWFTAQSVVDIEALRVYLQGRLPDYMVPSAYVHLDSLPLTANGKLDRKALPAPDQAAMLSREYEAPQGDVEVVLAQIWADLLKIERVGRHDHFFELGGHSLLAVSLIERMRQIGLSADVRALFSQPTLTALAAAVGSGREVQVPANLIPAGCQRITPELLTLVALDQDDIDRIVASVPGGAANVQDIYPLAPLQEGILYHHITAEQGDPYLLQSQLAFDSLERLQAFAQALQKVSERHDILRTSVVWEGLQSPVQVVWRKAPLAVQEIPLNPADGDVLEQLHARFDARQFRLELTRAPLIQLVYGHDPIHQRVVAILLFHHMALDHTAMDVVGQEMRAFLFNQHHTLGAPVPYRNYVAQARLGVSEQEHEAFFRDMLGDIDEPTLPFGLHDVQGDGRHVEEATLAVDATLNLRLRKQARQLGVSAASLMHLAWAQVLGKVSSRQQVVFGTVLMGRMQGGEGADRALGMFINTLPLRVDVSGICVQAGVKATHARLTALLGHEHASLALAQRCSGVAASSPLFSALLNYRHSAPDEAAQEGLDIWEGIQVLGGEERSNYPLTLSVDDLGNGFGLTVLAVSPIAAQRVCGYMHSALEHLVQSLEQTPQRALSQLSILPQHEQDQLLAFNPGASDYPRGQTIHGLFEAQARRLPDAIAVVQGPHSLNYEQLNQRANQLAHHLRKLDVQPDDRVAICSRRGPEMLVGLLAILKAGAGYVPVDPAYPLERIAYLLQDSAPVAVLVQASTRDLLGGVLVPVFNLDGGDWQGESVANPSIVHLTPAHLAYVIYTSGSTGLPKGVMVEHQTLENLVNWHCDAFDLREGGHTSSVAGFGFDAMAWEVWPALCVGATLHLPPASIGTAHIDELLGWWRAQPLDVSFLPTPVAEYAFSQQLEHPTLRTLLIGGDRLRQFAEAQSFKVINNYGPTEATVVATSGPVEVGQTLHIGKPMANARVYLLDEQQQPVPIGVAGELYVGGSGVARGYLNRPELTTERFLLDPFSPEPQARMYRTGDLARWLADGNIEYLGRNDDQVKIRGVRIELGEIEAALSNHEAVSEAVVLVREDQPGHPQLVAYFTEQVLLEAGELRAHLLSRLPDYMVPVAFVKLESLPLTANGKLDRKALPKPDLAALFTREYQAPQGDTETTLAQIWADVLHVERVGRHDHFFELVGHSLLAMRMVSQVRQRLGVELALNDLFANAELAAVAEVLDQSMVQALARPGRSTLPDIQAAADDQDVPLSFAQQRLWFLAQLEGASTAYNIPVGLRLNGRLDSDALQRALGRIVGRHETLRSRFALDDAQGNDEPQVLIEPVERAFTLHRHDLRGQVQAQEALQHWIHTEASAPFDLAHGPLIRGRLIALADDQHALLLTLHHIVADGWSMGVLTRELMALYQAFRLGQRDPLPPLTLQYGDFARWQRRWLSGDILQQQTAYWQQALTGAPALLLLPTDRPRPAQQDYAGASVDIRLDERLTAGLKALSQRHGTTLYMTMMAAWSLLLSRLAGQTDVVIGSPVANRTRAEIEGLIGTSVC